MAEDPRERRGQSFPFQDVIQAVEERDAGVVTLRQRQVARVLQLNPAFGEVYRVAGDLAARNYRFEEAVALTRQGMTLDQMDLIEINEAFAPVVLSWEKEHHPDMAKVNVNGGAIALGHPLGCSGSRLMCTLLNELERTGGRWGLQTMCEGGGMANATVIERLG